MGGTKFGILFCILLVFFSLSGCEKQEEYTNEQNMEAVKEFPQLINVKKYLRENFLFPENERAIYFSYKDELFYISLDFKESVTKK